MRFTDFLKATVLISAGAATALAVGHRRRRRAGLQRDARAVCGRLVAGWRPAIGAWLGRRAQTTPPIARLLARRARRRRCPSWRPGRVLLNRLWPLLVSTVVAGALAFLFPQVPAIATGFAIIWALAWRRQESAVAAIEERDGVRFYVEPTSPVEPIQLLRTPGFYSSFPSPNGSVERRHRPGRSTAVEPRQPLTRERLRIRANCFHVRVLATCLRVSQARRAVAIP